MTFSTGHRAVPGAGPVTRTVPVLPALVAGGHAGVGAGHLAVTLLHGIMEPRLEL